MAGPGDVPVRIVLVTGKGGVGKTTVAAASAVRAAELGHRTLVLSTDAAHSLADVLDAPLGHDVSEVAPNLFAQQLDGRRRFEESWAEIRDYLVELLGWAGADAIDAAELASIPGLDEIFALENLRDHAIGGAYDLVVVDCAPTAETLRLLALPEIIEWYLDRVFPTHRRLARVTRPVLRRATSMPLAGDEVFDSFARFTRRLDGVRTLLTDPTRTSVRLVTTPERVVVAETRRTHAYLSLFGYSVDALVVNRVLTDHHRDPFFAESARRQAEQLAVLDATFGELRRLEVPLEPVELVGPGALGALGRTAHRDTDPAARLTPPGGGLRFERCGDDVHLRVPLPGVPRDEVRVARSDGEVLVTAGTYRRAVPLPDGLDGWHEAAARFERDDLLITFTADLRRTVDALR